MYPKRTVFADDIVTEFFPAEDPQSTKVAIFCDGAPSTPGKKKLMLFFRKKGYWTFHPRYRGSWESQGTFLEHSPVRDVTDVIDGLSEAFTDVWSQETFQVNANDIIVVGGSFGGPAAILASRDHRVRKAIGIAPVVDWTEESEDEPLSEFFRIITAGYPGAYRPVSDALEKLSSGDFYNPVLEKEHIDGGKLLLIHAQDDRVVLHDPVERFAKDVNATFISKNNGGHLSSSIITKWTVWPKIKRFLAL